MLQDTFPDPFRGVTLEMFYRAINRVERSLIRTDADEVTYNLHIMMRFDLEVDLLEGRLQVKDLPQAWRARMEADLGVAPSDDRDGCLQDVHWYGGSLGGGFQGYTIGNILSAQFYAAAVKAHPEIPARDRGRPVRHAARLAHRKSLPSRPQIHAGRAGDARYRRAHEHCALPRLSPRQVWRILPPAGAGRPK